MTTPFHTCTLLCSYSGHSLIITAWPVLYYGRTVVFPSSLQHDLYFIMVVQWSFLHHYSTTGTLLWSYSGLSFIITTRPVLYYGRTVVIPSSLQHDRYFILVVQWSFPHHYSTTGTLFWSYSGHSLIITARPVLYYGRTVVIPSSLQHDLYFIMIVQWSFLHHYSTTCTLLWSYSGHSLIITARFTTNWPRLWRQWWLVYTCLIEVCLALGTKAETKTTANGPKEETKSETTLTASALKQIPSAKMLISSLNALVQSAGFSLITQPRLFLLPTSFHGLTTATVSSTYLCHPTSTENSELCGKTCSLGTPSPPLNISPGKKLHWLPISECVQYDTIQLYCLCVETFAFWLVI